MPESASSRARSQPGDPIAGGSHTRRKLAGGMLIAGGALGLVALIVPWVRAAYPAIGGDSASFVYDGPGLPLANGIARLVNSPHVWAIDLPSETLVFVALPVLLLIFGFAVVVNRGGAYNGMRHE